MGGQRGTGRCAEPRHRAIMGKSSGGFGAMITPMLRPDLFGALATHAGDSLYECATCPSSAKAVRYLRDYDGDIWRWWADFAARTPFTKEADHDLLVLLGVAACFSAGPDGTVSAAVRPADRGDPAEVWQRWLDWDPVRMVPELCRRAAGAAGDLDRRRHQGRVVPRLGAQAVRAALREAGVPDEVIRFELFDATHMAIDYRYPLALAWLCQRIAG